MKLSTAKMVEVMSDTQVVAKVQDILESRRMLRERTDSAGNRVDIDGMMFIRVQAQAHEELGRLIAEKLDR
jgi:hypothetical protein